MPALARKWIGYGKASGLLRQMIIDGSHMPAILDKGAELTNGLSALNWPAEAQACWSFVRSSIRYLEDPRGDDHFQNPEVTIKRGAGDCDDQVILLGSLLRSIGFQTRLVFVFREAPKNYEADFPEHVYLEVNVNKGGQDPMWTCAETIPLPDDGGGFKYATFGVQYPRGFREYFLVD